MKQILALSALLLAASSASAAPSTAAGKAAFATNCAGCHGPAGKGALGPNLHEASGWKYDLFKRALKQGKDDKGVQLKAMMPKWPQLTDDQMKSIQMFLKTATK